ncbi:MAG: RluA family pseudouridine synthase [Alphaproteobacteria bacterium]
MLEPKQVPAADAGMRLDRWLAKECPHANHGMVRKWLRSGQIRVDGKRATAELRLTTGQMIRLPPQALKAPPPSAVPIIPAAEKEKNLNFLRQMIIYEDEHLFAINKPAGLAVQGGTGTTRHVDALLACWPGKEKPRLVHRLDKDTSGVLLLAKTRAVAAEIGAWLKMGKKMRKYYWAITLRVPDPSHGMIDAALKKDGRTKEKMEVNEEEGKRAISYYHVCDSLGDQASLVALWPKTGRTHQLRAHLAAINTPIWGDDKYGFNPTEAQWLANAENRLCLHATRLKMPHPADPKKMLDIQAPPPPPMRKLAAELGLSFTNEDPFADIVL